jgi:serine/threonine protein kinase
LQQIIDQDAQQKEARAHAEAYAKRTQREMGTITLESMQFDNLVKDDDNSSMLSITLPAAIHDAPASLLSISKGSFGSVADVEVSPFALISFVIYFLFASFYSPGTLAGDAGPFAAHRRPSSSTCSSAAFSSAASSCQSLVEKRKLAVSLKLHKMISPCLATFVSPDQLHMVLDCELVCQLSGCMDEPFDEKIGRFYAASGVLLLHHLHHDGVICRGISSDWLLLQRSGYLCIADFRLSKRLSDNSERTYTMCGNPEYLAPEQISGAGHSTAVDLWCVHRDVVSASSVAGHRRASACIAARIAALVSPLLCPSPPTSASSSPPPPRARASLSLSLRLFLSPGPSAF